MCTIFFANETPWNRINWHIKLPISHRFLYHHFLSIFIVLAAWKFITLMFYQNAFSRWTKIRIDSVKILRSQISITRAMLFIKSYCICCTHKTGNKIWTLAHSKWQLAFDQRSVFCRNGSNAVEWILGKSSTLKQKLQRCYSYWEAIQYVRTSRAYVSVISALIDTKSLSIWFCCCWAVSFSLSLVRIVQSTYRESTLSWTICYHHHRVRMNREKKNSNSRSQQCDNGKITVYVNLNRKLLFLLWLRTAYEFSIGTTINAIKLLLCTCI